jgi:hypothetical protein
VLTGYRGEVHALWTSDDPGFNVKVLEVLVRIYDHPASARAQFKPVRAAKLAGLVPIVTHDGLYQLAWNRGNVYFLEIAGCHGQAVVTCGIAGTGTPPESDLIVRIYSETIGKLPPGRAAGGIPPIMRHVAIGLVLAAVIITAMELVAAFVGDASRLPVLVGLNSLAVLWLVVIPRFARGRAARRAARHGSTDEGIPLALASVGVTFPDESNI